MPPKKTLIPSKSQQTIAALFGKQPVESIQPSSEEPSTKKSRQFLSKWLKTYSWLRYVEKTATPFMYCELCTETGKQNSMSKIAMNTNFQHSTLARHVDLPDHKAAVQAPQLKADLQTCQTKAASAEDKAVAVLMKCVHWICVQDIPLAKYKPMIDLIRDLNVPDMDPLNKSKLNYESQYSVHEMLDGLSAYAEQETQKKIDASPVLTLLADESTDIANKKRLVIYIQAITEDMLPSTHYVCNVQCNDATGKGIASSIQEEITKRGIPMRKVMSFGSDGASVMTGKKNGTAAILRRANPHMANVHCIAHRLALCSSQASDDIPFLKQHQQTLTDLFYYFKGSSKREARLKEIQAILDDPIVTVKELHSVRWLSYFDALTCVYRTLDSLLTYLAEAGDGNKDPKAIGLKKKLGCDKFIAITYMMMDAMAPVTQLSQFFQTENVDIALVKVKLDLCMTDLDNVKQLETPYLKQLAVDQQSSSFKGHHITTSNFNLQALTDKFIDALQENIRKRFPDEELLMAFAVLGMRPISFLSKTDRGEYGKEEIDRLCQYYGSAKTVTWKDEENNDVTETSEPIIDGAKCTKEWVTLKEVVVAEKYPRDSMTALWQLIACYHTEDYPNMIKLAQLALTSAVHTAGCERGFSSQNAILTKDRCRLLVENQHKLMAVKMLGGRSAFNFNAAINLWKEAKQRRLYQKK